MNSSSILVLLRYAISALGTFLVAKGYFDQATFNTVADALVQIFGLVLAIAPAIYGAWQKRPSAQIAAVRALPNVEDVVEK